MSGLHIVPLPGIEPGLWRGFAMVLKVSYSDGEPPITDKEIEQWQTFAALTGARGIAITERELVVYSPHGVTPIDPGPCPFYMPHPGGSRGYLTCDLRAGHEGLCEHVEGDGPNATRATWGRRIAWPPQTDNDPVTGVTLGDSGERGQFGQCMAVAHCPDQAVDEPGGSCAVHRAGLIGVCSRKGCDRPALDNDCEVHRVLAP